MDTQLVQRTRYLLKARVKYALTCQLVQIQSACRQWLNWLHTHPIFSGIISRLEMYTFSHKENFEKVSAIFSNVGAWEPDQASWRFSADNAVSHAAFCFSAVRTLANAQIDQSDPYPSLRRLIQILAYMVSGVIEKNNDAIEIVRNTLISGFYEYLDEQLDARNALLGLLLKYKHRSEWFRKYRLRDIATNGLEYKKDGGERALAIDLYEYVFDQGVDFSIEPKSASGEADLIGRDSEGRHIVIDAKYISPSDTPSEIKKKLSVGFHQVARYCEDHNESYGYLVPYINHRKSLRLPLEEIDGFRYLTVKGKVIYYIPVDIGDHPSASQSGPADEIDISKDELLKETTDATASIVATDKT